MSPLRLPLALDVLVRHDGGAILAERLVAAGMIAMEMGDDEVADRLAGQRRDGGLDLAVQRRELAVHLMTPSSATATVMLPPSPSSI